MLAREIGTDRPRRGHAVIFLMRGFPGVDRIEITMSGSAELSDKFGVGGRLGRRNTSRAGHFRQYNRRVIRGESVETPRRRIQKSEWRCAPRADHTDCRIGFLVLPAKFRRPAASTAPCGRGSGRDCRIAGGVNLVGRVGDAHHSKGPLQLRSITASEVRADAWSGRGSPGFQFASYRPFGAESST